MDSEILKVSVSGTTNASGLIYTDYPKDSIEVIGASASGRIAIPFIGGAGKWGVGFYSGANNGIAPVINSAETAVIYYIKRN